MSLLDGLLSYWKMDEASGNALDAHGSNTLTDTNTVGSTTGLLNNARNFNGSDEYFLSTTNPFNGLSTFSFSAWVRATYGGANWQVGVVCACSNNAVNGDGFGLDLNGDSAGAKLRFFKSIGYSLSNATANSIISLSSWIHVVGTVASDGTIRLYIDGVLQTATGSKTGSISTNPANFSLGSLSGTSLWFGQLDEVGAWDRELLQAEVTELFNSGTPLPYSSFGGSGGGTLQITSTVSSTITFGASLPTNTRHTDSTFPAVTMLGSALPTNTRHVSTPLSSTTIFVASLATIVRYSEATFPTITIFGSALPTNTIHPTSSIAGVVVMGSALASNTRKATIIFPAVILVGAALLQNNDPSQIDLTVTFETSVSLGHSLPNFIYPVFDYSSPFVWGN